MGHVQKFMCMGRTLSHNLYVYDDEDHSMAIKLVSSIILSVTPAFVGAHE